MKKILSAIIRVTAVSVIIGILIYAYTTRAIWWPKFLTVFSPEVSGSLQGFGVVVDIFLVILGILFLLLFRKPFSDFLTSRKSADSSPVLVESAPTSVSSRELREFYYNNLLKECDRYDLGAIYVEQHDVASKLHLSDVYVDQEVAVFDPRQKDEHSEQRNMAERKTLSLFKALEEYADNHCIISGIVGSGKSSFVNFFAAAIIRSFQEEKSSILPSQFVRRPVLRVRLREIGAEIAGEVDANGLLLQHIRKQVRRHIVSGCKATNGVYDVSERDIEQYCNELVAELQKNGVLLLDGLDEVTLAEGKRQVVQEAIRIFLDRLPEKSSCRLILTSRPPGLTGKDGGRYQPSGFVRLEMQRMGMQQAGKFIRHWYKKKTTVDGCISLDDLSGQQRADHLIMQVAERPSLEELTGTPMLLTLMLLVDSGNHRLPESRAELYDRAVSLLLQRWHLNLKKDIASVDVEVRAVLEAMSRDGGFADDLREALARTALETYRDAEATGADKNANITFNQSAVLGNISLFLDNTRRDSGAMFDAILDSTAVHNFLENRSNILVGAGEADNRLQFVHKSFHEYLAAELYHFDDDSREDMHALLTDAKQRDWWREVLLFWMNARSIVELKDFIRSLLSEFSDHSEEEDLNNYVAALLLCFEAAIERNLARYEQVKRDQTLHKLFTQVQKKLCELMKDERLPVLLRAEAGRLLGELGDPRPGVTVDDSGRPHIDWVEIPSVKSFMMGSDDEDAYDNEKPVHPVDVESFSISRFPITNAQYRCFIEADGYKKSQYWQTEAARQWQEGGGADEKLIATYAEKYQNGVRDWLKKDTERRAPCFWHDRKWNNSNHPVVGVSWFEALAFCAWLSEVTGKTVRLPNEEEWEYAARGIQGLQYAWGDDFSENLGNTEKTGLERTSAVGLFPRGEAFGLHDMTGNVWEWTVNRWGKDLGSPQFTYVDWDKQNRDEREGININDFKVLRGGSWGVTPRFARCSIRYRNIPDYRYLNLGFRVVFSPAAC